MDALALTGTHFAALAALAFVAGIVRGFTGFALSAVIMVVAVLLLPPVEIIPMIWWLELSASLLMVRSGWQEADRRISLGLVAGSALGLPFGLWLTLSMDESTSKLAALGVIIILALSQLLRLRLSFLDSRGGLLGSGFAAGSATGLSGAGGMVVALYALALNRPARTIRASLVLFLTVSTCVSFFTHLIVGTMDTQAIFRGLALSLPTMAGVMLGQALFVPKYEPYYKPICLTLLVTIAFAGMARELLTASP